jgi:hypothetical protein
VAVIHPENLRAVSVAEKIGMASAEENLRFIRLIDEHPDGAGLLSPGGGDGLA